MNNLKTKIDKLDVGELNENCSRRLYDVVDRKVVKNTKFNTPKTKVNNLEKKNPDSTTLLWISELEVSGLVTTTILNIKISEIENKIPNISDLLKKKISMLKYQTLKENISLLQIIINLRVKYLMQR